MASGYVPRRIWAKYTQIHISPLVYGPLVNQFFTPGLGPTLLANKGFKYGPARDVSIDGGDPVSIDRTGASDPAPFSLPIRHGVWEVSIAALADAQVGGLLASTSVTIDLPDGTTQTINTEDPSLGDYRWRNLLGHVVEFLISLAPGFHLCYGVGLFKGRLSLPSEDADSVIRDCSITRVYPNRAGSLLWANLNTGVFDTQNPQTYEPIYPPPIVR